jgi:uncharacterized protein
VSRGSVARPLLVPVTTILRRPGVRHPFAAEVELGRLGVGDTIVAPGPSIGLDLLLEAVGDEVTAAGDIHVRYRGQCRRCLEAVEGDLDIPVQEIFERRPVEGETYLLDGEVIDLEPLVRDAVLLALPLAPLCRDDCRGPAPERFPAAGARPPDDDADDAGGDGPGDPRWAPLRQLRLE